MEGHPEIQYTSEGEEIIFRPANRWGHVFIQSIWVIGTAILIYWSAPALRAYFENGTISGAVIHLERFQLSPGAMKAAVIAWCIFLLWWSLGGLYEIAKILLKQDRFLLRSDSITVQRRSLITRELKIMSYEPMAIRLRSLDGALEVKRSDGTKVLTDSGTKEQRRWMLELLQQRYRAPSELPAVTGLIKERVGTYIVEKQPNGLLRIQSSGLSTIGCGVIAAVVDVCLIGLSIWLLLSGSGGAIIPILFAIGIGFAGLGALNKRTVEASRGKLRVQSSSPVGKLLQRFVSSNHMLLKFQFGEGSYERESGSLAVKVTPRQKSSPAYSVILVVENPELDSEFKDQEDEDEMDDLNEAEESNEAGIRKPEIGGAIDDISVADRYEEELVLNVHGEGSEHTSDHLMRLLAEATGFPIMKSR